MNQDSSEVQFNESLEPRKNEDKFKDPDKDDHFTNQSDAGGSKGQEISYMDDDKQLHSNTIVQSSNQNSKLEPLLDREQNAYVSLSPQQNVELARFGNSTQLHRRFTDVTSSQNLNQRTQSTQSGNSQMTHYMQRMRQQQGVQLKLKQTWFDHFKIFMYHFIEPILLASAMAICLQLPTLSSLVYILIMFLAILPLLLSANQTNIKMKWFLCCLMILIAGIMFIFKLVMIIKYNKDPSQFQEKEEMWKFLGVYDIYPGVTLSIDLVQMFICSVLVWHLNDQRKQATKRLSVLTRLDYQTEIKLHHPYFGRKHHFILKIAYILYLIDTFIMLTFPQLVVTILLITLMLFWYTIVAKRQTSLTVILRVIQAISVIQVLIAFFIGLPIVADTWLQTNPKLAKTMGLDDADQDNTYYDTYMRIHYVAVCLAVVCTEVYVVSTKIFDKQLKRIKEIQQQNSQNMNQQVGGGGGAVQRQNSRTSQADKRGALISNLSSKSEINVRQSKFQGKAVSPETSEQILRLQRSKMITQKNNKAMKEEKSFFVSLKTWWNSIKDASLIWICRTIAFAWVYCYHDIQSVVILVWLLHSTIYKDQTTFKKWMIYVYMPLITAIFLWYYTINIFGLLSFWPNAADNPAEQDKKSDMYTFGYFQFQIPFLETMFMYGGLFSFTTLTFSFVGDGSDDGKFEQQLLSKIGNAQSSLFYQFLFIFLVYIEYPLMLFLVIAGLDKMDVYHITMLFFFVWYTLSPKIIKNNSIFLLVYANAFILEKYIYTLFNNAKADPYNWVVIMGFSTDYDSDSTNEYFRYPPKFDQWILVFLTFCLYRRQALLGTDNEEKFNEHKRKAENQIKLRMPRLYRFYIILDVIYTYAIVIMAFTLYLVIIVLIRASLINALTQTLVLMNLCIYLASGIKKLLDYWKILIVYQAIVLVAMVVFQFFVQAPGFNESKIHNYFENRDAWLLTLGRWAGFVKFDEPLNLKLLPYVVFFSLAVILNQNFKQKLQIEKRQLYTLEDCYARESNDDLAQSQDQFANLDRLEKGKMLEKVMKMDPQGDYDVVEPELIYNYGHISGVSRETSEILHHKQTMFMKQKLTYLTYRMQKAWPIFDALAAYIYLALYVSILAFALYYQLALFWAIALTIYMISQFINSSSHYKYRQEGRQKFIDKVKAETEDENMERRLLQTEQQILINRKTVFQQKQQQKQQLNEIRAVKNRGYSQNYLRISKDSNALGASQERISARFGNNFSHLSIHEQRESQLQSQLQLPSTIEHNNTQNESLRIVDVRESNINTNQVIEPNSDAETQENRRLKVTDEEVLQELEEFQSHIHQVSIRSRYYGWISLFILLIVGLTLIYCSDFVSNENDEDVRTDTKRKILFLFFWSGVYSDTDYNSYASSVYPFYILMIFLVIERVAQLWIETRFGCTKDLMQRFKQVEQQDQLYLSLAKERKKNNDKTTHKSMRSQTQRYQRNSRSSIASGADIDKSMDSLVTDSEFNQSRAMNDKSLLTIEEEKSVNNGSLQRSQRTAQSLHQDPRRLSQRGIGDPDEQQPDSVNSINQSWRETQPAILQESGADLLIQEEQKEINNPAGTLMDKKLSTIKESLDSNQVGTPKKAEKQDAMKKRLIEELKPMININSQLKCYRGMKKLLENICILLVWFSCIYKQNFLSLILFIFLVIYTFNRSSSTLLIVRTVVVVIFVLQYWLVILNLSDYNSPKEFPQHLRGVKDDPEIYTVYPNPDHYYYDIPVIFAYSYKEVDGVYNATADLTQSSYLGLDVGSRKLNGIWIDFIMTIAVAIYFSLFNFWMLFRPVKIEHSKSTEKKLKQYAKIMQKETGKQYKSMKLLIRDIKQQFGMSKLMKSWTETLYTTFPIMLIAFTLAISIFNQSILSFGYIVFVMVLTIDNIQFLKKRGDKDRLYTTLKYFMLPYLLIDILLQLIYQMPIQVFQDQQDWSTAIGFDRVWTITPMTIYLGEEVVVDYDINSSLTTMMLKGVTFFLITIQLQLISSYQYQKFMQTRLENREAHTQKVGRGITYRFNNFKSKAVLTQAKENQTVERMLKDVKRLIRKRQQLYEKSNARLGSIKDARTSFAMAQVDEKSYASSSSSDNDENKFFEKRLNLRSKNEKDIIKKDYEGRMEKINCCNKLYLWVRRHWVVDILFQQSEEHLDDIVDQMKNGRTSIKTTLEIGVNNLAKKDRKNELEQQLKEIKSEIKSNQKALGVKVSELEQIDDQSSWVVLPDKQIEEEEEEGDEAVQVPADPIGEIKEETSQNPAKPSDILEDTKDIDLLKLASPRQKTEVETSQSIFANVMDQQSRQTLAITKSPMQQKSIDVKNDKINNIKLEHAQIDLKDSQEKKMIDELLKSKTYRPSSKPWEIVNMDTFLTWQSSLGRYFVLFFKITVSYSELLSYFFMLLAAFMKAGWLYMIYPLAIFGYCMIEEQRPGKIFWFTILFYTQALIIFNFVFQLKLWTYALNPDSQKAYTTFFDANTLGIQKIEGNNFGSLFIFYFPEICILFSVLVHIQKESLAGVFNVPYESYENFEAGLLRYRLQVLCNTEAERRKVNSQFLKEEAMTIALDKKTIDEFRENDGYLSECDKFKRSEQTGDPIRREMLFKDKLEPFGETDMFTEYVYNENGDPSLIMQENENVGEGDQQQTQDYDMNEDALFVADDGPQDLRTLVQNYHAKKQDEEDESSNAGSIVFKSEDNIIYKSRFKKSTRYSWIQQLQWLVYDNPFMNRLFPEIKQQKPGSDLYVYIATVQILLIIYVFLFYSFMQGNESDIATQFASNQYSTNMVFLIIVMISIMMVDRILYSTHAFSQESKNRKTYGTTQDVDGKCGVETDLNNLDQSVDDNHKSSMLLRKSGQLTMRQQSFSSEANEQAQDPKKQNNWVEQYLNSENSSDNEEADNFFYNKELIPQRQKKTFARVFKFYWFWFILLVSHYFVFFGLPSTVDYCIQTPQQDSETGDYISYYLEDTATEDLGEKKVNPKYDCNTFTNNGWIITFYLFLCAYFYLQAYQMRIGLPEIRRGSFLMDTFNPVSGVVYRGYLAIPFIFELRTLVDWTFTSTALDAFQWIKLSQIQANMYVAKCVNKDYMERELGSRIKKWEKIVVGCGLIVFIITMIIGPIVLFSALNPIAQIDQLTGGQLKAELAFRNLTSNTNQTLPLFATTQVTQIKTLTNSEYNYLDFQNETKPTSQFQYNQVQVIQFSETSDFAWIISQPKKDAMLDLLNQLVTDTLDEDIELYYTFDWAFDRQDSEYGSAKGLTKNLLSSNDTELVDSLIAQINCTESKIRSHFPADITITKKTNQDVNTLNLITGDPVMSTNYTLTYFCSPDQQQDLSSNYWSLAQDFNTNQIYQAEVDAITVDIFSGDGFGFFVFEQKVLPSFFASYGSNLIVFYVGIVFVVASLFRSALVPRTWEIFIIDAPHTEDILKICQSIHVYRVQREMVKEEELYMILIDIMRSPEMIKALTKTSLKKKLQ